MSTTNNAPAQDMNALIAELAAIREENARLKLANQPKHGVGMKVSEKGALSVYGLGRFPVTLYKGQWTKLLEQAAQIQEFIKANDSLLASKD